MKYELTFHSKKDYFLSSSVWDGGGGYGCGEILCTKLY